MTKYYLPMCVCRLENCDVGKRKTEKCNIKQRMFETKRINDGVRSQQYKPRIITTKKKD